MTFTRRLLLNRYLLSLVFGSALTIILLLFSNRYIVKLVSVNDSGPNYTVFYNDLDSDGISERIEFHNYRYNVTSLIVYQNNRIIDQWNFDGEQGNFAQSSFNDFDNDGYTEIIFFTELNDTLYLNSVDPLNKLVEARGIAVSRINRFGDHYDYSVWPAGHLDFNGDSYNEFSFSLNSGFSLNPRGLYIWYPGDNMVKESPDSYAIIMRPNIFDIDGDGRYEIFGSNMATGNSDSTAQYSDWYGWLMVFNSEMEFVSPPVRFDKYPCITEVFPFETTNGNRILIFHDYRGSEEIDDFFALYDGDGVEIKRRDHFSRENVITSMLFASNRDFRSPYFMDGNGVVSKVNDDLSLKEIILPDKVFLLLPVGLDLDLDGSEEQIFLTAGRSGLIICRNDLTHPVILNFDHKLDQAKMSVQRDKSNQSILVIDTDEVTYNFSYLKSPLHNYWYLVILSISLFSVLISYLVVQILNIRSLKLTNARKSLAELQMKSVQNQIDPHFTFNLLESFAGLINEKDTERAEYIFNNYSRLLKTTVLNSDKIVIEMGEEIGFIESYLGLEEFRSRGRFGYKIYSSTEVDLSVKIPKMLLHIFVENAIKHGLKHLVNGSGHLTIDINPVKGYYQISIEDNGIGRAAAAEIKTFSSGKGLKIIDQIIDLSDYLYKQKISYKILDLFSGDQPSGTRVDVFIPRI